MSKLIVPDLDRELVIEPCSASYPTLGVTYKAEGYRIHYSPTLVHTGKNYYDSRTDLLEGVRLSTAGQERALQRSYESTGKDPREADTFDDPFESWFIWQWTDTGLRVPKGWEEGRYDEVNGYVVYPRIILLGDKEVGEILVPQGNGRVVIEWDEVFGIPRITSDKADDRDYENHNSHFYFDPKPEKDPVSGNYDVAVARRSGYLHIDYGRCFNILATASRTIEDALGGFRQVRGLAEEIEKEPV